MVALDVVNVASMVAFSPVFVISAIYTCLASPLDQSRDVLLNIESSISGDEKGGQQILAAMSDGPLVFQVSHIAADNIVSSVIYYKDDGLLADEDDDGLYFEVSKFFDTIYIRKILNINKSIPLPTGRDLHQPKTGCRSPLKGNRRSRCRG